MPGKHLELNWVIMAASNVEESVRPRAKHSYDLLNTTENEALMYGERKYGINLVWGDPGASDNIRFQRQAGTDEPLKFGELVAINVRRGGFLRYQKRDYGINLNWADGPVFEWKIMGGAAGGDVQSGKVIALFNTVEKDHLFYDPRTYGINLKWVRDVGKFNESWAERAVNKVKENAEYIGAGVGAVAGLATGGPVGAIAGAKAGQEMGKKVK
jgi:hypothetical protein